MIDDEDVMPNVQREKKLNLDFAILVFTQVPNFDYFIREFNGKSMEINANLGKVNENVKLEIEVMLFLSLYLWHHSFVVNHSF